MKDLPELLLMELDEELLSKIEEAWAQANEDVGLELAMVDLADMPCSKTIH